jgi:hypothetical protein
MRKFMTKGDKAMELNEMFSPAAIGMNWTENVSNRMPYMGEGLFPTRKQAGLDLKWFKGSKGIPVSLMPSAFDAKATFRDRIGMMKMETEMPFFREGFKIKERDRQDILRAQDSKDPYVNAAIARVFDDARELIEGALVVGERMRMQLLFAEDGNVGITIQANGVDYTYNYDPDGSWKRTNYFELKGQDKWTDADHSDPFGDIQTAKDAVSERTGSDLRIAIMNKATFKNLRANEQIKNRYLTKSGAAFGYLTDNEIIAILKDTNDLDGIVLYDKQFRNESKVASKFVPDGYVALVPAGSIGQTCYGTTPEEADLMGKNAASVQLVEGGIHIDVVNVRHALAGAQARTAAHVAAPRRRSRAISSPSGVRLCWCFSPSPAWSSCDDVLCSVNPPGGQRARASRAVSR